MAPSSYYLFRSLQHHLAVTHFVTRFQDLKSYEIALMILSLRSWLASIFKEFVCYQKNGKRSLMQTGNIALINFFIYFRIKIEFTKKLRTFLYTCYFINSPKSFLIKSTATFAYIFITINIIYNMALQNVTYLALHFIVQPDKMLISNTYYA